MSIMNRKVLTLFGIPFVAGFIAGRLTKRRKKEINMPAYCEVWLMGNRKGH